jgi:DNA-binding response OmpR family regulator
MTVEPDHADHVTILVVDDDAMMMRMIRRTLQPGGWTLLESASSREAEAIFAVPDQAIDLLLVDVVLPDGDGVTLAARARVLRPNLRLLFMSGYGPEALASRGVTNGPFIGKPFGPTELRSRMRDQLGRPAAALT